jgi:hypothetical protein
VLRALHPTLKDLVKENHFLVRFKTIWHTLSSSGCNAVFESFGGVWWILIRKVPTALHSYARDSPSHEQCATAAT